MSNDPSVGDWDWGAMEQLPPADRIDYISDRLAADFKNKTPNVGTAILALRHLTDELREGAP